MIITILEDGITIVIGIIKGVIFMKKFICLMVLLAFIAGGIFAQENFEGEILTQEEAKQPVFVQEKNNDFIEHWISGEISLLGFGVRYEYNLSPYFSVGMNVYAHTFFLFENEFGLFHFNMRFYPGGKAFFMGLGAGYHFHTELTDDSHSLGSGDLVGIRGAAITPEIGWKINPGKKSGFYFSPGLKVPVTFGMVEKLIGNRQFGVGYGFVAFIGLGGCF